MNIFQNYNKKIVKKDVKAFNLDKIKEFLIHKTMRGEEAFRNH